ncbi:MAG: hypothetical protein DHS20C14_19650 [Phycisphaeraceae bacterium]|nr:MAG: hypothetical protein DHS20C14_19650 [Phycisphaeraceae bacterium]
MTGTHIDLSQDPDIASLTQVLRHASTVSEPAELTAAFGRWLARRFDRDYFVSVSRRNMDPGTYKITRAMSRRPTDAELRHEDNPPNPWRDWDTIPTHTGGVIGEILEHGEPALVTDLHLARDPVLAPIMGDIAPTLRTVAAMPTFDKGESINWAFSFSRSGATPTLERFGAGLLDINMMGAATRNLVALRDVDRLNARLRHQLEQVASLQRSLLPERTPKIPGVALATSYLTSAEAGGDYYDFFDLGDGRWGILIADVAGHGAAAATVMAMLRAILHAYEGIEQSPRAIMAFCNAKLAAARLEGSFTTAFYAVLDTATGEFTYARCGHNPPRLRRADGSIEALECAGALPLGVDAGIPLEQATVTLAPGDTVVLYTDGITEAPAPGPDGRTDMFGTKRLDAALAAHVASPGDVVDAILSSLYAHTRAMTRDDDQTLVVVRYLGAPDA